MSSPFLALGAPAGIADRLAARGITEPFPIQAATLVDAMAGRDVCGKAPTGSGKTIAFGIPLVARATRSAPKRPKALVLLPTRELAAQVAGELSELAGRKGPSIATFYGGVGFGAQLAALRRGVDIAVACPGRLADLVNQGHVSLDDVEIVVLDEADRMADMGFLPEVRRLLDRARPDRQTLLFSATLDGDVDVLIRNYQRDPVRHEIAVDDDAVQNRHVFWSIDRRERVQLVAGVVGAHWPAVVFCRTKHGADRLARQLDKAGVKAAAIHGDRSQGQRERALAAFASGKVQALVATDVAARGIHVDDVAAVVHYDLPASEKDYVHRSGRTGRAGAAGVVVSMIPDDQERDARAMQRKLGYEPALHAPDVAALVDERHAATPLVSAEPVRASSGRPGPARPSGRGRNRRPRRPVRD
jgi:superfamily II DNA/RNA helicase